MDGMGRRGARRALVLLVFPVALTCTHGPGAVRDRSSQPSAERTRAIRVTDALLADRLVSLAKRSPTWRAAMDSLAATGFQVLVMDAGQAPRILPALRDYEPD
ncbi:MAG: hypothetical protein HY705_04675, partial [Gemmatimonadetes bacterium]|nr:hypothetical protein [Gemmatimonadota bacterium]